MRPSNDREAITLILDGLRERGVVVTEAFDGEEMFKVSTTAEAVAVIMTVDEGTVYVRKPDGSESFIYFVLGNAPEEVACDYGVSLEEYIDPIVGPWWEQMGDDYVASAAADYLAHDPQQDHYEKFGRPAFPNEY